MASSTSASIEIDVTISEARSTRVSCTVAVVIATLIVYDALLCIDLEAKHVWRSPKTSRKISRVLYIYNRYLSILWNTLTVGEIGTISDTVSMSF
ncbi:hypothetical protein VTO73DRAFT_11906 [Trametes versicolor]